MAQFSLAFKVDIQRFIKHDIPFRGKLSYITREQREIQEIIDVLWHAVSIVNTSMPEYVVNIRQIRNHLKQHKTTNFVTRSQLNRAKKTSVLSNPLYKTFKSVLNLAEIIISSDNLEYSSLNANQQTKGYLVNVAELFEVYIRKLLAIHFPDWQVSSPIIEVYPDQFFKRKIIPDIVMEKEGKVAVFDTKYKRMRMRGRSKYGMGDVDRNDFFQINTYMSYYDRRGKEVIAGGLLYPLEVEVALNDSKMLAGNWFSNPNTIFLVDGIELDSDQVLGNDWDRIIKAEGKFINRMKDILK